MVEGQLDMGEMAVLPPKSFDQLTSVSVIVVTNQPTRTNHPHSTPFPDGAKETVGRNLEPLLVG